MLRKLTFQFYDANSKEEAKHVLKMLSTVSSAAIEEIALTDISADEGRDKGKIWDQGWSGPSSPIGQHQPYLVYARNLTWEYHPWRVLTNMIAQGQIEWIPHPPVRPRTGRQVP